MKGATNEESPAALRVLPWLLLLPLAVLAWPWPSLIAGDFATLEHTALGAAVLVSLPLAGWLVWRRSRPSKGSLLLLVALFLPVNFARPHDSLELDRALLTFLLAVLCLNAASLLKAPGRRHLTRGLICLSLILIVPALIEGAPGWGGVLGNSGELSGAALPGALCGFVLWSRSDDGWQWIGMFAVGLWLLHAILAPVIAALLVLALVAAALAIAGRKRESASLAKCLVCLALSLGAVGLVKSGALNPALPAEASASTELASPTQFGGIEVRLRLWGATLELLREHPRFGVGAGQFAVEFPAVRDPLEQDLSNWNHRIEATTEVEHPHNDWILPWAEGGILAGIVWWLFLFGVLRASWRSLCEAELCSQALAAGAFGGLAAAFVNAPLFFNPFASVALFALFGCVLGPAAETPPAHNPARAGLGRFLISGLVILLLLFVPRAAAMWSHGRALARMASSPTDTERGEAIAAALMSVEDSVVARTLEARLLAERDGDLEAALASWNRVLKLRPLRFEAWMQRGVLLARLGRLEEAQGALDEALELDPRHPALIRNRARLAAQAEREEDCLAEIEALVGLGEFDSLWLRDLACDRILHGSMQTGQVLLARADRRFDGLTGEVAWALREEYRRAGSPHAADAFRTLANWLWAQEHAANANWGDARRAYFQALRVQRETVAPAGPLNIRVQEACCLWFEGRREEAAESLAEVDFGQLNWARFPAWCQEAMVSLAGR